MRAPQRATHVSECMWEYVYVCVCVEGRGCLQSPKSPQKPHFNLSWVALSCRWNPMQASILSHAEWKGETRSERERENETARMGADSNAYLRYVGALTAYSNISSCSGNHVKLRIIKVITLNPPIPSRYTCLVISSIENGIKSHATRCP